MKAVVAAFNQKKALVGAFSVLTNLKMELFQALVQIFGLVNVMDIGQVYVSLITTIPNNCVYTCCPKGDNSDH